MGLLGAKGILIIGIGTVTAAGLLFASKSDYSLLSSDVDQHQADGSKGVVSSDGINSDIQQITSAHQQASPNNPIFHLFGKPPSLAQHQTTEKKDLPETRLNLTLKGTFTHQNDGKASALIAEGSKHASRFFIGDEIPGGAELMAVGKGEITLRRNGRDELLKLPFLRAGDTTNGQNQRRNPPRDSKDTPNQSLQTHSNNGNVQQSNPTQEQLKERLARLRNKSNNTPPPKLTDKE